MSCKPRNGHPRPARSDRIEELDCDRCGGRILHDRQTGKKVCMSTFGCYPVCIATRKR